MTRRYQLIMIVFAAGAFALSNAVPWHESAAIRKSAGLVAATLILWISEAAPLGVTALVVPMVVAHRGTTDFADPRVPAALVAAGVAFFTRSTLWTLVAGMAALWALQALAP